MTDEDIALLTDLHIGNNRQGPGSEAATRRAIALAGLKPDPALQVADIGCGTGAASLVLARDLGAQVTAVDFLPAFLDRLGTRAAQAGLAGQITPLAASMEDLPFAPDSFDVIWSEGAIYNMGFEAGLKAWRPFLRPGGMLVVSELTWLTATRPAPLQAHWDAAYPQVATAGAKIAQLEAAGYRPEGYFALPTEDWLDHYYRPMQARFDGFLARHDSAAARAIIAAEQEEIALYEAYRDYVSYGVYIARRFDD